jgi:hypothetical protein
MAHVGMHDNDVGLYREVRMRPQQRIVIVDGRCRPEAADETDASRLVRLLSAVETDARVVAPMYESIARMANRRSRFIG